MTSSTFATSTIPITSSTGAQSQVKVAVLANGVVVPAHAFVDAAGQMLDPAKDTTVQTATAAILAATSALLTQS